MFKSGLLRVFTVPSWHRPPCQKGSELSSPRLTPSHPARSAPRSVGSIESRSGYRCRSSLIPTAGVRRPGTNGSVFKPGANGPVWRAGSSAGKAIAKLAPAVPSFTAWLTVSRSARSDPWNVVGKRGRSGNGHAFAARPGPRHTRKPSLDGEPGCHRQRHRAVHLA